MHRWKESFEIETTMSERFRTLKYALWCLGALLCARVGQADLAPVYDEASIRESVSADARAAMLSGDFARLEAQAEC